MKPLYEDKNLQIFNDKITFKAWCLPWGKKEVGLNRVKKYPRKRLNTVVQANKQGLILLPFKIK